MIQGYHDKSVLEAADRRGDYGLLAQPRAAYSGQTSYQPTESRGTGYSYAQPVETTSYQYAGSTYQPSLQPQSTYVQREPVSTMVYQPSQPSYEERNYLAGQTRATAVGGAVYTPQSAKYEQRTSYGGQPSPALDKVKLVESNPDYKVYQYRSVKKETIHIDDGNRRVVTGDRYSDGTPVKRNTYSHDLSPEAPFNPRRSTTYSNSKYITVVRNGQEVREEILDYN